MAGRENCKEKVTENKIAGRDRFNTEQVQCSKLVDSLNILTLVIYIIKHIYVSRMFGKV